MLYLKNDAKENLRMKKTVVLAYSGGLDTTVIGHWLTRKGYNVIAYMADIGQEIDMQQAHIRAGKCGIKKLIIDDMKKAFAREFLLKALKAHAVYEGGYLLATALSRPLIAREMVGVALKYRAQCLAHGCTGKGNDQVRFELSFKALAPHLEILAPVRTWEFSTREDEIGYLESCGIHIPVKKDRPYSIDANLGGVSIESGDLEDPWKEPPEDAWQITVSPEKAPDTAKKIVIRFEKGVPVALEGRKLSLVAMYEAVNKLGGRYGVGRVDMIENRLVGIKSRELYESPAGAILLKAHGELESLVLDKRLCRMKEKWAHEYAGLIYEGMWESAQRKALDAAIDATQEKVTGEIALKLYKGHCAVTGRRSSHSLYRTDLATYGRGDIFDRSSSKGFIDIWGLSLKVGAERDARDRRK